MEFNLAQIVVAAFVGAAAGAAGKHFWHSLRGGPNPPENCYSPEVCRLKHEALDAKMRVHKEALDRGREKFDGLKQCINEIKSDVKVLLERTEKNDH